MPLSAYALYCTTVLVWGSTWLAIKFQLGAVDPLVSVIYRFGLASLLLFAWCVLARARLRLAPREHAFIALQGCCLFGLNYWLVYWAEVYLASGIVAVVFATMVFMNFFNAALFLKRPLVPAVLAGGLIGMVGVALLFWPELGSLGPGDAAWRGLLLALAATYVASLGSIVATRNAGFGLKVITVNAWGMFYGTALLALAALVTGVEFRFPAGVPYAASLLYLSVFGSIVAFGAYLRLIALIGPERAGYNAMMTPVVALLLSTLFEGYRWTLPAAAGLVLIVLGNAIVLRRAAGSP
jgi:drug/metabolite transporter (DMT)-like permease